MSHKHKKINMYEISWVKLLKSNTDLNFKGTDIFFFANGYQEALKNVQKYGLKRVKRNLTGSES